MQRLDERARTKTRGRRRPTLIACAVALCLGTAHAAQLDYEATAGVGYSDNLARTEQNAIGEEIATAGLLFSLDQTSARLTADMIGNLAYYDYLDNTYDAELLGNFAGMARWQFVPERFSWMAADNFGQVLRDAFAPSTPENRENINYFTTGPDIMVGLGAQTRLRLGGRYSLTTYEDSPFDSDMKSGEVELLRMLSSATSISLNARKQRLEYDEVALNSDYDQSEAFLRYSATGARTELSVDAGYTEMDRKAAADAENGLLLRLEATRRVSTSSTVHLRLGSEFSSAGAAFATSQGGGSIGLGATPGRQVPQPFTHEYATLGWNYVRNRTGFGLSASRSDQSYDGQPLLDQSSTSISGSVERDMSNTTTLSFDASFGRGEFETPGGDYDELSAGMTFSWRLSSRTSLHLTYDYFDRASDAPDGDFTENRYWLSIGYGRGVPRSQFLQPQFAVDAVQPGT